mmetsp:Transcript_46506/g.129433  ORF Transcript_46506/g.129433 Transcript_46506/m.129433 type:complete len:243 (+) Transcript_46506:195-923(+)
MPSTNFLPFCKNWNTAVATSTLSGFLSGCHALRSFRHSRRRSSLGSTFCKALNFSSASIFASLTSCGSVEDSCSSFSGVIVFFWSSFASLLRLRLRLRLLSFLLFDFFAFFFFFLALLLDELLIVELLDVLAFFFFLPLFFWLFEDAELADERERDREREADLSFAAPAAAPSFAPFSLSLNSSLMAREPAWGDKARFGRMGTPAARPGAGNVPATKGTVPGTPSGTPSGLPTGMVNPLPIA